MKKNLMVLAVAVASAVGLVACGEQDQESAASGERLQVVATYSILGDIVRNVGGENVESSTLVGRDGDAHTFEPTPSDGAKLTEADIVFENGLQFETWLDDLYESSGTQAERVVATEGIEPLAFSEEEGHSHAGHDHEASTDSPLGEEVDEISPRLLVTDGEEGRLRVVDTGSGEVMDDYEVEDRARVYSGEDGVLGYAVQGDAGLTNVVKSGFTVEPHGDHDHLYETAPSMSEARIQGDDPVHFVAHDGEVAIFNDGDGTAQVFDESELSEGSTEPLTTIETPGPHHGVAVPMGDRIIASAPNPDDPEELPNDLNVYDTNGERVGSLPECPEMHGEASSGDTVAFACAGGILVVEKDGESFSTQRIPYPEERDPEDRAFTILADEELPYMIGDFGEDSLLYIDPNSGESRTIELPNDAGEFVLSPEHGPLVITTDGRLHAIDPDSGEPTGSVEVAEPFSIEGDFEIPRPAISEAGETAYVSDPESGSVSQVDLEEMSVSETYQVGGTPAGITTLGPAAYASTGHSHEGGEEHSHEHGEEGHAHEHGEFDPHVWFDASNAVSMTETVRDALVEADPENADAYERNADEYIAELEELDSWISEVTSNVPEENRRLVTSHDTFGYFAEAYGYEVVGTGLASFSTEASDPSAGETAELVQEIESAGVPAIFTENVSNPAMMEQVASEAGVELAPPLYTDALGEEDSEGATYIEMMRYDVETMTEALGGG